MRLSVETVTAEHAGVPVSEYKIRGFRNPIDLDTARHAARFLERLTHPGERLLVGFSPFFKEDEWDHIAQSGWTTLSYRGERVSGRTVEEPAWVMGFAHTTEKLAEVFRFAWNYFFNNPFVIVVAPVHHRGAHFAANHDEVWPGNERALTEFYPTVIGCYYDAQRLTVASIRLTEDEVIEALRATATPGQGVLVCRRNQYDRSRKGLTISERLLRLIWR